MLKYLQIIWVFTIPVFVLSSCNGSRDSGVIKIGLIAQVKMCGESDYWRYIKMGVDSADQKLNATKKQIEIITKAPLQESDKKRQKEIFQEMMDIGVQAIAVSPNDTEALIEQVNAALEADLPVIVFDSELNAAGDYTAYVGSDNKDIGRQCAKYLVETLGAEKIAMLRFKEGTNSTFMREEGFLEYFRKKDLDSLLLTTNQFSGTATIPAFKTAEGILNRFKNIDGIFCSNEGASKAMLRALKIKGLNIDYVGCDITSDLKTGLKLNDIDALLIQDPIEMGYRAVMSAYNAAKDKPIGPKRNYTPINIITKDNLEEDKFKRQLDKPVVDCE